MDVVEMGMQMEREDGLKEGGEKQKAIIVQNLLSSTDFTDEKIASICDVSPKFVREIRIKLNDNN